MLFLEALIALAVIYLAFEVARLGSASKRRDTELVEIRAQLADMARRLNNALATDAPRPEADAAVEAAATAEPAPEENALAATVSPPHQQTPQPVAAEAAALKAARVPNAQSAQSDRGVFGEGPDLSQQFAFMDQAVAWVRGNWFLLIAAISLALAGIFLVQYGIEQGLLSPAVRIVAALVLGLALLGAAEWLRRRKGDESAGEPTAYLPSTLASGGVVTLFGAIWGSYGLYDLVPALYALVGLCVVGVGTILLGWFYGPLLSAIGVIGALVAPFLIGGSSESVFALYYYFALIVVVGLAIDAAKRWQWLSVLAVFLAFVAAGTVFSFDAQPPHLMAFALIVFVAAIVLPHWSVVPVASGPSISRSLIALVRPDFPTVLATGTAVATIIALFGAVSEAPDQFWFNLAVVGVFTLIAPLWLSKAPALDDAAALPFVLLLAFIAESADPSPILGWIASDGLTGGGLIAELHQQTIALLGVGLAFSLIAAWRGARDDGSGLFWVVAAVAGLPLVSAVLDLTWNVRDLFGASVWGAILAGIALVMLGLAGWFRLRPGPDTHKRISLALLSATVMVAYALFVVLSSVALTLALGALALVSVLLDRRFDFRALSWLGALGAIIVSARLVVMPGIDWAVEADWLEFLLVFAGSLLLLGAGTMVVRQRRPEAEIVFESAFWAMSAVAAALLIYRLVGPERFESHWSFGLLATVWLILSATQFYRARAGGLLAPVRQTLGTMFAVVGLGALGQALIGIVLFSGRDFEVIGPPVINSLLIGYGLPALVMGFVAIRFGWFARGWRWFWGILGMGTLAIYVVLAIRHIWRGPYPFAVSDMSNGELYTYTAVMLAVSSAVLFGALWRRSPVARRLALIGLGLTAAKVFLVDAGGLTGLTRVVSFLALGLALAALAWLDRRFSLQKPALTAPDAPPPVEG